jgi:chromosomal replication initiator protein
VIAAHLEPKGLTRDAKPLADHRATGWAKADAVEGSARLRDAILGKTKRPAIMKRRREVLARARTWKARQLARVQVLRVQVEAANYFKISTRELVGARGDDKLARKRQIAMYLARETTPASYPDIGLCFGGRNHATVIHACRVVEDDPAAQHHVREIRKVLG